ncbi:MAG: glycoside hydrolase family 13 domain protein [Gemmatimonadetes bacterium]|nr:glycoside hydrolase family 13 domain protein [Gemmatimonadota bacterium]
MSDEFERRVEAALRAPVGGGDARSRRELMERVRRAASEGHAPHRRGDAWRRSSRHSIIGLAFAAGVGGITTLSALVPAAQRDVAHGVSSVVLGDTVVSTLRDTLRLVRLMLDAPMASSVSVAGDFNGWGASPTALTRDPESRRWSVTLALHAGAHRYAFVVDETRWVPDPRAEVVTRGDDGRLYSLLNVGRTAN